MRRAFVIIGAMAAVLYVAAEATLKRAGGGDTPLRWATDANPARNVQTSKFSVMFPALDVEVDPGLGGDQTKLIVQCATGTGPDIIDVYGVAQMMTLVNAGVLMDLTPYAKDMGFGPDETWPAIRDALTVDGRLYRYPCNIWANAVIYNTAVFDDHGVPYPEPDWTYEDFIATCRALKTSPSKSGERHVTYANWNPSGMFNDFLFSLGGRYFSADGLRSGLASPQAIEAMRRYHDLLFVHEAIPTPAEMSALSTQGGWGSYGLNIFSIEKAAMINIGRWYIIQMPNFPGLKGKLRAVPFPRSGRGPASVTCGTRAAGINVKSPRRMDALNFLSYLASEKYSELIALDGDSLPPNPRYARTGRDLVNPSVTDPAFHQVFIDAMTGAHPVDQSPFIESELVGRWFWERMGEVENRITTPEEAMRSLADEIDKRIRRNLERRPSLQRAYREMTGREYRRDWWRKREAGAA